MPPLRETTDLYDAIREDRLTPRPDPGPAPVPAVPELAASRVPAGTPERVPMVGREAELEAFRTAWEATRSDGRLVLIEGEAGIGKTRLARSSPAASAMMAAPFSRRVATG